MNKLQQTDYDGRHEEFNVLVVAILNDPDDNIIHRDVYTIDGIQIDLNNVKPGIYLNQIIHLDGKIEYRKVYIK